MNTLEVGAHPLNSSARLQFLRTGKQFAEISARAKSGLHLAIDNERMSPVAEAIEIGGKLFQFVERQRANLIAGLAMQCQLHDTVIQRPRNRLTAKRFHLIYQGDRPYSFVNLSVLCG